MYEHQSVLFFFTLNNHLKEISSTSNNNVAFGGIIPPMPWLP